MVSDFNSLLSDFYRYMTTEGGIAKKTSCDYISRLRFLYETGGYKLDTDITPEYIDEIMISEENARKNRERYASKHAMGDFRSGLNKFLSFVKSDYRKRIDDSIRIEIDKVERDQQLPATEKEAVVLSRIGQGSFRQRLIEYWHGCSISSCGMTEILVASHIKPWRVANNKERLDVYNGLLLLPNYDKLFDLGYLSFDFKGRAIYSKLISNTDKKILNLSSNLRLINIEEAHKEYLKFHQDHCFIE